MKKKDADILRKYIKESLLVEYYGLYTGGEGGYAGAGYPMIGGYASLYGRGPGGLTYDGVPLGQFGVPFLPHPGQISPEEAARGFKGMGQAFKDVGDAAKAVAEKGSAAFSNILKVGASGILEMLSAGLIKANYEALHKEFESEINSINSKYSQAIQRSYQVLGDNAPLAAIAGLPAALTVKVAVENPKLFGAVLALAGVGGADTLVAKATSLLGVPGAAKPVTAAVGAALTPKKESVIRNVDRIVIVEESEEKKELTPEKEKELEKLIPQIQAAAEKGISKIEAEMNSAVSKFSNKMNALTSRVGSALQKSSLDEKQRDAAMNLFKGEQGRLSGIKDKVVGDKASSALQSLMSKTSDVLGSIPSAESGSKSKEKSPAQKSTPQKQVSPKSANEK